MSPSLRFAMRRVPPVLVGSSSVFGSIRAETEQKTARSARNPPHPEMQRRAHGEIEPDESLISDSLGVSTPKKA